MLVFHFFTDRHVIFGKLYITFVLPSVSDSVNGLSWQICHIIMPCLWIIWTHLKYKEIFSNKTVDTDNIDFFLIESIQPIN